MIIGSYNRLIDAIFDGNKIIYFVTKHLIYTVVVEHLIYYCAYCHGDIPLQKKKYSIHCNTVVSVKNE